MWHIWVNLSHMSQPFTYESDCHSYESDCRSDCRPYESDSRSHMNQNVGDGKYESDFHIWVRLSFVWVRVSFRVSFTWVRLSFIYEPEFRSYGTYESNFTYKSDCHLYKSDCRSNCLLYESDCRSCMSQTVDDGTYESYCQWWHIWDRLSFMYESDSRSYGSVISHVTYGWVKSHITYGWVILHVRMSHECVMSSHIQMSHVTHIQLSHVTHIYHVTHI